MVLLTVALPVRAGILQPVFSSGKNYLTIKIYYFREGVLEKFAGQSKFSECICEALVSRLTQHLISLCFVQRLVAPRASWSRGAFREHWCNSRTAPPL